MQDASCRGNIRASSVHVLELGSTPAVLELVELLARKLALHFEGKKSLSESRTTAIISNIP